MDSYCVCRRISRSLFPSVRILAYECLPTFITKCGSFLGTSVCTITVAMFVCGSNCLPHSQIFRCVLKPDELDDGYDLYSQCRGNFSVNLRG